MEHKTKPHGGYRTIPMEQLCLAWCAYGERRLSWLAFRAYLAVHEVAARREAAQRSAKRKLAKLNWPSVINQVHELVSCARTSQVQSALEALRALGLVVQTDDVFPEAVDLDAVPAAAEMFEMSGRRGSVPVPRQALRYLAAEGTSGTAAYMLAVIVRCCHVRGRGAYRVRGRCSTRFAAELFGIHQRTVKRAAVVVRGLGWIAKQSDRDRWSQRHGPAMVINRDWKWSSMKTPPRNTTRDTKMSPLNKKQELLSDLMNQEGSVVPAAGSSAEQKKPGRSLHLIEVGELTDIERLLSRFTRAVEDGLVSNTPASRLRFVAAAQRALRVATRNACGLFVTVVRENRWSYISLADEDRAYRMLKYAEAKAELNEPCGLRSSAFGELVASVVGGVSWPEIRNEKNDASIDVAARSKNRTRSSSPQAARTRATARSDSTSASTFSTTAA